MERRAGRDDGDDRIGQLGDGKRAGGGEFLDGGGDGDEIADRRGVSVETLRSQLRSVYSKTGCSRETELVLLVKAFTD